MFHSLKSICVLAAAAVVALPLPAAAAPSADQAKVAAAYGKLPLTFEVNEGQTDNAVKFLSRGQGYSLFLTQTGAALQLKGGRDATSAVRWQAVGGNRNAHVIGESPLATKSNYFIGNDPKRWRTGVSNYAKVRIERVYPGIDLVYHGSQRQVEYDFVVAPKTNPSRIRLAFQGVKSTLIGEQGELILRTAYGDLVQPPPLVYQELNGQRQRIEGRYALLAKNEIGFTLGRYDPHRQVTIDPVLLYGTYLGASDGDAGFGIAVDSSGNAYVTGFAASTTFPGVSGSSIQPSSGGDYDAFVTKINAAGTAIAYSTYLGGSGGGEYGLCIAVDSYDNAYIAGATNSTNFPGTGGSSIQSSYGGGVRDAFLTKINAAGTAIVYSTYLGGNGDDLPSGIAVDGSGNAYVSGVSGSTTLPGISGSSISSTNSAGTFLTKINPAGTATVYSTFDIGGWGIAVDGSGNVYVVGGTSNTSFPGVSGSSAQPTYGGGGSDGVVTKVNAGGTAIVWSTYLGGSGSDTVRGIALDGSGNVYVAGNTDSSTFPGVNAGSIQSSNAGNGDAFVTKLNSSGTTIIYSTFLGGPDFDLVETLAVDSSGNAYVAGGTLSATFPGVSGSSIQPTNAGNAVGFVTRINAAGTSIDYSTFLGGTDDDEITALTIDGFGNAYVTGHGSSTDFPVTVGSVQTSYGGGFDDAFVAKIGPPGPPVISSINPSAGRAGDQITIVGTGFDNVQGSGGVWLGSNYTGSILSWSNTQIVATIAWGVSSGVAQVFQSGVWSNAVSLTVVTPHITSISPSSGRAGDQITITGTGFGSSQGSGNVWLGSTYGNVVSWSDTQVVATIVSGATSGVAQIYQYGVWSNTISLMVVTPHITSISPSSGRAGDQITITGTGFGSFQGSGNVWLGSTYGTVVSWSDTQVVATIVSGATAGVAQIYQYGVWSNTISLTVITPHVTSISPSSGRAGDQITITGTGFGSSQGSGNVWLGSTYGTVLSWSDTQVVATIVSGATSGVAQIYQYGVWSNTISLTVITPHITSISPTHGPSATQITFTGTGFGSAQGSGNAWLGSTYGTVVSWSDTQIVASVASGASSGAAQILQNGVWSNTISFSVP